MSLSAFPSTAACRLFNITWCSACPLPPPSSTPLLSLVIFQSRHPPLPPPHPPLIALSGHPPCLFRWNRRGNESQSPLLTHSWDFALLLCAFLLFFTLVRSVLLIMICITRRESLCYFFFVYHTGNNSLASTKHSTKNTSKSQLPQIQHAGYKSWMTDEDNELMCTSGYSCIYDFNVNLLCQKKTTRHILPILFAKILITCVYTLQPCEFMCVCACVSLCSGSGLFPSLPRSCLVTMQPGQHNMDTTVAWMAILGKSSAIINSFWHWEVVFQLLISAKIQN